MSIFAVVKPFQIISIKMQQTNRKRGYWTINRVLKEALKYETRNAFQKGSSGAYNSAFVHGWIDELCEHMTQRKKKNSKYDFSHLSPEKRAKEKERTKKNLERERARKEWEMRPHIIYTPMGNGKRRK